MYHSGLPALSTPACSSCPTALPASAPSCPALPRPPPPALLQMAGPLVAAARDRGVIVITAGKGDIVRLVPPLIVRLAHTCCGEGP